MTSSTTTTSQDVKAIQDRQSDGRGAVIDAANKMRYSMNNGFSLDDGPEIAAVIEAAMMALVDHWRAEADIWEASKKRGGIGTAKELRQCASRLAGFAVGLTTRPVTISIPVPPLDNNKGGGCGDPNCDFQVQCGKCSEASQRQYDEWYARHGYSRSMHRLVIDEMRDKARAEAIHEHQARGHSTLVIIDDPHPSTNAERVGAMAKVWDNALCTHPTEALSARKDGSTLCTACQTALPVEDVNAVTTNAPEPVDTGLGGPWKTADGTEYPTKEAMDDVGHLHYPLYGCARHEQCRALPDPFPKPMTIGEAEDYRDPVGLRLTDEVLAALPVGDPVANVFIDPESGWGPWQSSPVTDPVAAVLTGDEPVGTKVTVGGVEFTKIGTNPFAVRQDSWTPQDSEETALRDIIGPLGASATALVDNPFTRPNVPWLNRPAVAVVPYQNLPAIAAATGARDHVSHSYVEGYESCSLAAMLKDASRAGHIGASRPGWSQIAGKAFHAAVEAVERAALTNVTLAPTGPDLEAFWMAFFDTEIKEQLAALVGTPYADSGTWYVSNRGKEGFDWWRVEGARMLKMYLDHHTPAWRAANQTFLLQDKTPVIELEYDMTIRSLDEERGLRAKGFIDKATLNMETYSLTVLDYKTGARDPDSTFQLGEYGHALLMAMGIAAEPADRPILGSYWLARKGIYTTPTAVLQRHPLTELQYRYDQAARGNKAGIFAPHVSNFCTSCSVKDYCPTQAGRT